jgi:hypothetical protein
MRLAMRFLRVVLFFFDAAADFDAGVLVCKDVPVARAGVRKLTVRSEACVLIAEFDE